VGDGLRHEGSRAQRSEEHFFLLGF
jgi:hypothetical protein